VNPISPPTPTSYPAAGVEVVTRRKGYASAGHSLNLTLPNRVQATYAQSRTLALAWFQGPLAAAGLGGSGHGMPSGLPATAVAGLWGERME
jgi:hypothetical protein